MTDKKPDPKSDAQLGQGKIPDKNCRDLLKEAEKRPKKAAKDLSSKSV